MSVTIGAASVRTIARPFRAALAACCLVLAASSIEVSAQSLSQRGFVEGRGFAFPEAALNDATRQIGDVLVREEAFFRPAPWIRFAAGLDLRANSHDQVEEKWRLDFNDRSLLRPRAAVRRLTATITAGHLTVDAGKQFIRWGRTDILNPTDRFAPRDYLNVIDSDFLPVLGVRPSVQVGNETFEAVWVPRLTPSRLPLLNQRWTVLPPTAAGVAIEDAVSNIPQRSEQGVRWTHTGGRFEGSLSYFDGFNHLPDIESRPLPGSSAVELTRVYPALRMYGGDLAVPTPWLTLRGEAGYFSPPSSTGEEYVLYVVEIERQTGEWLLDVGYAGEVVRGSQASFAFAPDRAIAKSILGRASYTVDPRRTIAVEGAVRQDGEGFYVKGEFSEAFGRYWRLTLTGVGIAGDENDFFGQYHRNVHGSAAMRFSF